MGGAPAAHHRVHGTGDGQSVVAETYGAEEIFSEEARIVSSLVVTAG